ncbi:hypothetical protein AWY96_02590 [Serratia plymuthica]|uniref:hypothetical protein n=1 Tax=Serratia plymuthica TaxID=82996 RepID=UPI0007A09393|nr:hypothetical protein [Serratia plymuthica]KYQ97448.1 hypothetical protein AWY96_02590 [Serratia plymuthica]
MKKPDIGVIFEKNIPSEFFEDFENSVKAEGLNLVVESREPTGPMACSEWFILPVVFAFIGKSYFDGFLKEMGKDHYQSAKESLSNLTTKIMKTPRIEPTLFGSQGKISSHNSFSLAFSILAEAEDGYTFKLLIPKSISDANYGLIANRFMEFLSDYHLGIKTLESIGCVFEGNRPPSSIIFVHYNSATDSIEWLNEKDYR